MSVSFDFFSHSDDADKSPRFFRCTEWKGRVIFSIDFNELAVDHKVVRGWLDTWIELVLTLTK